LYQKQSHFGVNGHFPNVGLNGPKNIKEHFQIYPPEMSIPSKGSQCLESAYLCDALRQTMCKFISIFYLKLQ